MTAIQCKNQTYQNTLEFGGRYLYINQSFYWLADHLFLYTYLKALVFNQFLDTIDHKKVLVFIYNHNITCMKVAFVVNTFSSSLWVMQISLRWIIVSTSLLLRTHFTTSIPSWHWGLSTTTLRARLVQFLVTSYYERAFPFQCTNTTFSIFINYLCKHIWKQYTDRAINNAIQRLGYSSWRNLRQAIALFDG